MSFTRGRFSFQVQKAAILDSVQREQWEAELKLKALPDILFGQNCLIVSYRTTENRSFREIIKIDCYESLKHVKNDAHPCHLGKKTNSLDDLFTFDDALKVLAGDPLELSYATTWRSSRHTLFCVF